MFEKAHAVFESRLRTKRGPHLHVGYCLYQLLRLLGRDVCAEEFPSLKTADVALANDRLWADICAPLGWRFHPTV